jgi:hypothetical protein
VGQWLTDFFSSQNTSSLVSAYKAFFDSNKAGFIKAVLPYGRVKEAPKEFPDIEYEVKLDIMPVAEKQGAKEPSIADYLAAFDFPAVGNARFLKDPVDSVAEGTNHFYGAGVEERLVVIEKMGKTYLKEKSQPLQLKTRVPHEDLVIKRTEKRYPATMEDILKKVSEVHKCGGDYAGNIRKEKGDAFILDTYDGRIYSFTITRAHLAGKDDIQRQLEIEYAGYVPGFNSFEKDSEKQIVAGMVDLARMSAYLSHNAPVKGGWRIGLFPTSQRKYDFVSGKGPKRLSKALVSTLLKLEEKENMVVK